MSVSKLAIGIPSTNQQIHTDRPPLNCRDLLQKTALIHRFRMVDVSKGVAFGQRLLFCRSERKGGENMAEPGALDYFYGTEAEQYTFYRIPKVLFTDPGFRRITADAKILYGLMLDRMGLSIRNNWLDEQERVFIYFTLEEAMDAMCCGHNKAVSLFTELDKVGLIERKKQGQGRPTKIYVKNFTRKEEVKTSENRKSALPETGTLDFRKSDTINTDKNKTDRNDTDPSIHPAAQPSEDRPPTAADAMDTIRAYREILKENIEYDILRKNLGYDCDLLDEILDILVDTVCSTRKMIRIGGEDYPKEVVKSRLLKLDSGHIEYVISSLHENTTKVRNIRAYLLTSLYNAPTTINSYYTALVNHDRYSHHMGRLCVASLRDWR